MFFAYRLNLFLLRTLRNYLNFAKLFIFEMKLLKFSHYFIIVLFHSSCYCKCSLSFKFTQFFQNQFSTYLASLHPTNTLTTLYFVVSNLQSLHKVFKLSQFYHSSHKLLKLNFSVVIYFAVQSIAVIESSLQIVLKILFKNLEKQL